MITNTMRCRVEALTWAVDPALDTDHGYFAQREGRAYRLRKAFPPEIEVLTALSGPNAIALPDNWAWFTAVRQFVPGVRVRAFGAMLPLGDDPPEPSTKPSFEAWSSRSRAFLDRVSALVHEGRIP
jgi:hypothetical protein